MQSVNLCLFIGELGPMMLRDIKDQLLLVPLIFIVSGEVMFVWFSSSVFVVS